MSQAVSRWHDHADEAAVPVMGGEELARRLSTSIPNLRILCISGYLDEPSSIDFGKTGWSFLEKPFTYSVLAGRIRDLLDSEP